MEEGVNAMGTEQPFGRVQAARELGKGPTQTGGNFASS